jgi:3-hydroxyisobutyrate dehydrogenase-like beta-hydroxyacid dehydrogenase
MSERARIGFIGLGVMGGRMAGTLARAGYPLAVHDIDPAKVRALVGATACASPSDVAQRSDIVLTSLPLPATVRSVYLGADGVLEGARPGMVLVDTSTVDPETTRTVNAASAARGVQYLDAPVSGGWREAETGALVINILARNFAPGFTVDLARKDLGLAVDMARCHDVPVPATSLLNQLYNACAALGEGASDFAAIIKLYESWTRTEVKVENLQRDVIGA